MPAISGIPQFHDRVKKNPGNVAILLGHVIAHQVTHIPQGLVRHSEWGHEAQWTVVDYQGMTWKPLRSTNEDVMLIHHGLRVRETSLVAVAVAGRESVAH